MSTAATLTHRTVVTGINRTDVQVSKNAWNDSLVAAGGLTGALFILDSGQSDGWGVIPAVAVGAVLASAGTGTEPVWATAPSVTSFTASSFVSAGATPASAGLVRLSNNGAVSWRNAANNADLGVTLNASNIFTFDATIATPQGTKTAPAYRGTDADTGMYFDTNQVKWTVNDTDVMRVSGSVFDLTVDAFEFRLGASNDVVIARMAADKLKMPSFLGIGGTTSSFPALKRSSAEMHVRLADDSGFASVSCGDVTTPRIHVAQVGSDSGALTLTSDGTQRWFIASSGHLSAIVGNTYDFGTSGAPRNVYVGTSVIVGTSPATSGAIALANDAGIVFRNAANTADVTGLSVNSSNKVLVGNDGDSSGVTVGHGSASGGVEIPHVGPHAVGSAASTQIQWRQSGSFTGVSNVRGFQLDPTLTIPVGGSASGIRVFTGFVEAASGTHDLIATVQIETSSITTGAATVNDTASLYVAGAMSAVVNGANYAVWVDAGDVRFDANLRFRGIGAGDPMFKPSSSAIAVRGGTDAGFVDFQARTFFADQDLCIGSGNQSSQGSIRLPNNSTVMAARNAANNGNLWIVQTNGSDEIIFGEDGTSATGTKTIIVGTETTDPAAPAANGWKLYARDNGAGKTQVCVRFPTGAVQVLATEP